ncbi:hypothetical protein C8P63_11739 [Melghirimyces profundicolus]|uniref:Uncharacterized protein n=1 Tax=Melghirimyces profundicolus TaxID=1242148 RepID=A0A2T6BQH8_9BACL|nr:hypothetical protein C8P63_11739 [Melghirimyces profundicolus]
MFGFFLGKRFLGGPFKRGFGPGPKGFKGPKGFGGPGIGGPPPGPPGPPPGPPPDPEFGPGPGFDPEFGSGPGLGPGPDDF